MADDKQARDEQADREEERQRGRMQEEALTRADEEEPMRVDEQLGDLDEALKAHDYPATTFELVEAYGDYELETQGDKKSLEDVLSPTDDEIYDSAEDVHRRILGLIGR